MNVHFLWRTDRLYVMDNHRCALWCWWQQLDTAKRWNFLHADYHYDAQWAGFAPWNTEYQPAHQANLTEYLAATVPDDAAGDPMEIYRWDTFVTAFIDLSGGVCDRFVMAGAVQGAPPHRAFEELDVRQSVALLEEIATRRGGTPWIVDVDLDVFSCRDHSGRVKTRAHAATVRKAGSLIRRGYESGSIGVVTVALSPDNTGSWERSERLLSELLTDWPDRPDLSAPRP